MPRDIQHIIHPPSDPIVTVGIASRAIAGKIVAWIRRKICLLKASMIAKDRLHLPRPRVLDAKVAFCGATQLFTSIINENWLDAKKWLRCRTWFQGGDSG